jgi:hypothetical protein
MNKQETTLVKQAMKAMEAEISGSYGLGYPTARKANKGLLDALTQVGATWTLVDFLPGKAVHPVMGFGDSLQPKATLGMSEEWQQGLWALCHKASRGKGIVMARVDVGARDRVVKLAGLYKRCQMILAGEAELGLIDGGRIQGYLKAEWPTNA